MFLRRTLLAVIGLGVFVSAAPAQSEDVDSRVDALVQAEMARQKIPGLSLAVMRGGTIIKAKGYGLSNVELDVQVVPESVFQFGSVRKQFTATAVMMLVKENRVGLDDKITKYFPEAAEAWHKIAVRHLLTHTSGLKDYTDKDWDYRRDYAEDDILKRLQALPLEFAPGEKWSRSNSGYVILGFLIRRGTWSKTRPEEYGFHANLNPFVSHPRWSQAKERGIGEDGQRRILIFNGYEDEVGSLYAKMNLKRWY